MGASHFLLLPLLAAGLAQAAWNSRSSLPSVNPWATHSFRDWLRSVLLNRRWSFLPQKNTGDDQESLYQDDGKKVDPRNILTLPFVYVFVGMRLF